MFAARYFAPRYFAITFFAEVGAASKKHRYRWYPGL